MNIIKLIPFYLFLALNAFVAFVYLSEYPNSMTSDQMPWNAEGLGWAYENRFNYTLMVLINLIFIIAPSVVALKLLKTNLKKAYFFIVIPFFVFLGKYIYYSYFVNI